ncbi:MAG: HAMP domain-containing protein [Candidatus Omnitrophica bacterium]|nr:HAMP domain-containing protein [Candidatus Omnitrophota bacterium]
MIYFQSVKLRLTLWYTFILSIFLTIFAVFMYLELSRALYRDADQILLTEAINIEESLQKDLASIFTGARIESQHHRMNTSLYFVPPIKAKLAAAIQRWEGAGKKVARSQMMIRLLGLDHEPLIMNLKRWEEEVIFPDFERDSFFLEQGKSFQTIHFRKIPVRLYYRLVRHQDVPLFIIQCGVSIQEVRNTLHRLLIIFSISIPMALGLAFMAGWFMAKRSFRPLDLMIREARQITGPDIRGRLPRTHRGDELDRLAETLNEMMDRIEASKTMIRDFSSDISHELRTPLAIIRGEIDLALRRVRSAEDLTKTLRVIEGEVNELIRLVDDLIFLVRTDAKQLRFEMLEVSLSSALVLAVERFKERAAQKSIHLESFLQDDVVIKGDAVYLKRLFSNLVDNAIKFTPEGGSVTLRLVRDKNLTRVEIQDTGMGIEPEKIPKLFSRFYRTESARQFEGSGLGLNIVKAICDAHRGTITLHSHLLQGTTVSVTFPLI